MSRALSKLGGMFAEIKINVQDPKQTTEAETTITKSRKSKQQLNTLADGQPSSISMTSRMNKLIMNIIVEIPSILGIIGGLYSLYQIYTSYAEDGKEVMEMMVISRSRI